MFVYVSGLDLISAPKVLKPLDKITFKGLSRSKVLSYPPWVTGNYLKQGLQHRYPQGRAGDANKRRGPRGRQQGTVRTVENWCEHMHLSRPTVFSCCFEGIQDQGSQS